MAAVSFGDLAAERTADLENEFEESLIAAIKGSPCLYATDHPDYNNIQLKKLAWISISNGLKRPVTDCMNKWYGLLQIFLHRYKPEKNNLEGKDTQMWPHYESLKELVPYLAKNHYELMQFKSPFNYGKPTNDHRKLLLHELALNRSRLLASDTTIEDCQMIWAQIAEKLNKLSHAVNMPVIKWQKFWKDMKQSVSDLRSKIWTLLQALDTHIKLPQYFDEVMKILAFCGASPKDNPASINEALSNDFEFGFKRDCTFRKCKKCSTSLYDLSNDYCQKCIAIPKTKCDICLINGELELIVYQVKNWSSFARKLLPTNLKLYDELAICADCLDDFNRHTTKAWKACRVCENYIQPLESLFIVTNEQLLKIFKDATNITFNESDGLPGYICKVCKVQMQQFNNFYLRFSRAQTRLSEIHAKNFIGTPPQQTLKLNSARNDLTPNVVNNVMIINRHQNNGKKSILIKEQLKSRNDSTDDTWTPPVYVIQTKGNNSAPVSSPTLIKLRTNCETSSLYSSMHTYTRQATVRETIPPKLGATTLKPITAIKRPPSISRVTSPIATSSNAEGPPAKRLCSTILIDSRKIHPLKNNTGLKLSGLAAGDNNNVIPGVDCTPASPDKDVSAARSTLVPVKTINSTTIVAGKFHAKAIPTKATTKPVPIKSFNEVCIIPQEKLNSNLETPRPPTMKAVRLMSAPTISTKTSPGTQPSPTVVSKSTSNSATNYESKVTPIPTSTSPMPTCPTTAFAKRIPASHPAVFTIPPQMVDYEKQDDSPPVFCISKTVPALTKLSPSPKIRKTSLNSPVIEAPKPTTPKDCAELKNIKTEKMDETYPYPGLKVLQDASYNSSKLSSTRVDMDEAKQIRADGPKVRLNNTIPSLRAKETSFQNAFVSSHFAIDQPKKAKQKIPRRQSEASPLGREVEQQEQVATSKISKRQRKYWGTVDEFKIATEKNAKPIASTAVVPTDSGPQQYYCSVDVHHITTEEPIKTRLTSSEIEPSLPAKDQPSTVGIKKEDVEKEEGNVPSMFYPDSFELENVCLNVDVSLMMEDTLIKQEMIENNVDSFRYINPSFLISYVKEKDESKDVQLKEKDNLNMVAKPKENVYKENTVSRAEPKTQFPLKKLRVKLKRSKQMLGTISLRTRKKWQQPAMGKRKSLRLKQ